MVEPSQKRQRNYLELTGNKRFKAEKKHTNHNCTDCEKKFKSSSELKQHRWHVHSKGDGKWFHCTDCEKKFKTNSELTSHLWHVHTKGDGKLFDCTDCEKKFKTNSNLKKHRWQVHSKGDGKWFDCTDCEKKFKSNSNLKKHRWQVHSKGNGKWFHCTDCKKKFKTNGELTSHLWFVHTKGDGQLFDCTDCDQKFKFNGHLKVHLWYVHSKGDGKWFHCTDCDYKCKSNGHLKSHRWHVHSKGDGKWFHCTDCDYKSKSSSHLKRHLEFKHDIGEYECEVCCRNRNSQNEWTDKHGNQLLICRECYNKATGKNSRVEKIWSDYLDEQLGTEFLVGSDRSLRSLGGCSLKRPDKMYASSDLVEIDECDEHQHCNDSYQCEDRRLSELYDDPSICGKKMVVVRWNPHSYTPPEGVPRLSLQERLELMVELKKHIRANPPKQKLFVYYICFDEENTTTKLPSSKVYKTVLF